ncbi:MAG: CRISPR-associated protein Cas4, partial [Chloroflexi bacterium]|nr:CRISPR-associated protein Cas4 [Chloroflexota bacterium]
MGTEGERESSGLTFRVGDLKQYFFCPRIVYYQTCLPGLRPTTFKMRAGKEAGEAEQQREERRSLRRYGLQRGECSFDLALYSDRLGLRGRLDMAIRTDDNEAGEWEAIPVDYKMTPGRVVSHFALQVVAYGMLLEEWWGLPVQRGFLYLIPARRARLVPIT